MFFLQIQFLNGIQIFTEGVLALREAENFAKRERRGLWADVAPTETDPNCRVFEATVVEIQSGDTVIVLE